MRTAYEQQLSDLTSKLAEMCAVAEFNMQLATQSLLAADLNLAEQVIGNEDRTDALAGECENRAFTFLALQAPVAGDLRAVVGAVQIVFNLHRMSGLARHIAEIARQRHPMSAVPDDIRPLFAAMSRVAIAAAATTRDLLVTNDLDSVIELRNSADRMDQKRKELFARSMDANWSHGVTPAVDVTLLGRFYERFTDHTAEISDRVVFLVTGERPDRLDADR